MNWWKRLRLSRTPEAQLNWEASKAAVYFMDKTKHPNRAEIPSDALNLVAKGFYMGVRWMEDQIGVKNDKR
jgi:hypothetical protein